MGWNGDAHLIDVCIVSLLPEPRHLAHNFALCLVLHTTEFLRFRAEIANETHIQNKLAFV